MTEEPQSAYRRHLISLGVIRPLTDRPTLKLDEWGHVYAAKHIAAYLADPFWYQRQTFKGSPP